MDLECMTEAVIVEAPDFINFTEIDSFHRENAPLIYKIDTSKYTNLKGHLDKDSNFKKMQNELNCLQTRSKRLAYLRAILNK